MEISVGLAVDRPERRLVTRSGPPFSDRYSDTLNDMTAPPEDRRKTFERAPQEKSSGRESMQENQPEPVDVPTGELPPAESPEQVVAPPPTDRSRVGAPAEGSPGTPRTNPSDYRAAPELPVFKPSNIPVPSSTTAASVPVGVAANAPTPPATSGPPPVPVVGRARAALTLESAPVAKVQRVQPPPQLKETIFEEVRLTLKNGQAKAEFALDPPELGRMSLSLEQRGDRLVAHLRADHPVVQETLEKYLDELKDVLRESGADVDEFIFEHHDSPSESPRERAGFHSDESDDPSTKEKSIALGGGRLIDVFA